jgi:hypothetical protein
MEEVKELFDGTKFKLSDATSTYLRYILLPENEDDIPWLEEDLAKASEIKTTISKIHPDLDTCIDPWDGGILITISKK